jgi:hypothetical protein
MITRTALEDGDLLLQVPKALFITADTARRSKLCGALIKQGNLDEWQVIQILKDHI